jgi:hypothetical protein
VIFAVILRVEMLVLTYGWLVDRMFIPVGPDGGEQDVWTVDKDAQGKVTRKKLFGVRVRESFPFRTSFLFRDLVPPAFPFGLSLRVVPNSMSAQTCNDTRRGEVGTYGGNTSP